MLSPELVESVRASRAAQGLPPTVEDPRVLDLVAGVLQADVLEQSRAVEAA
jgi:hypothetical protein